MIMKLKKLFAPGFLSFAMQRLCTWYVLRALIARFITLRRPSRLPSRNFEREKEIFSSLTEEGYAWLPQFVDPATILRIQRHLEGALISERFSKRRSGFTIDNIPSDVHVAEYETQHLLNSPDIVALAMNPVLIDAASAYLGCKPTISNLSLWWSFPTGDGAQEAENYHRDVDDWRFVKFFLYLTDVDEASGPHRFVRGSNTSSRFLFIKRFTDQEVERCYGASNCLTMLGSSGDAFLEDTFGLHKGQPPTGKRRLVFQVQYSINAISVYDYEPRVIAHLPNAFDAYTARLYITQKKL